MSKLKEKKESDTAGYPALKYSFVQIIGYRNENILIGLDKNDSNVYYWNIKAGKWLLWKLIDS